MAFSQGATGLSHLPWCFESIFGVTIESVQGSQVYLECIGTLGSFGMVAQPWEFFSNVKLRLPPLEVQKPGFLSRQSREMDRHVVMSRENRGSS